MKYAEHDSMKENVLHEKWKMKENKKTVKFENRNKPIQNRKNENTDHIEPYTKYTVLWTVNTQPSYHAPTNHLPINYQSHHIISLSMKKSLCRNCCKQRRVAIDSFKDL